MNNSLVQVVRQILEKAGRENLDEVRDYSDIGLFDDSMLDPPTVDSEQWLKRIIVLWGRTPSDPTVSPVEMRMFLSPVELALIWAAKRPPPQIQVLILDLGIEKANRSIAYEILRWRPKGARCKDWLQYYFWDELESFGRALCEPAERVDNTPEVKVIQTATLAHVNTRSGADSLQRSHHDLANLAGPQLLFEVMGKRDQVSGHQRAARDLVCALVNTSSDGIPGGPWIAEEVSKHWRQLGLQPVLLDDMAHLGWKRFLCCALGEAAKNIEVFKQPEDLTNRLKVSPEYLDNKVLFCDLRLFSAQPDAEQRFLEWAMAQIKRGRSPDSNGIEKPAPLWPRLPKALESEEEKLTILPRLLAHRFPSLPIIIFSSTLKVGVARCLSGYGSIILDFQKPQRLGDAAADTIRANGGFRKAVKRAVEIAAARKALNDVVKAPVLTHSEDHQPAHLEVYVDESGRFDGNRQSKVGGLVVIYPTKDSASSFARALVSNGFLWGYHRDEPLQAPPLKEDCLEKYAQIHRCTELLKCLDQLASQCGITVARTIIVADNELECTEIEFDAVYRQSLRALLTLVLDVWSNRNIISANIFVATRMFSAPHQKAAEFARQYGKRLSLWDNNSCEPIYTIANVANLKALASKYPHIADRAVIGEWGSDKNVFLAREDIGNILQELVDAKIVEEEPKVDTLCRSFDYDDVLPLLNQIYASWRRKEWRHVAHTALGVTLRHFLDNGGIRPRAKLKALPPYHLPRLIHYAVDWVLGTNGDDITPAGWKMRGFNEHVADANKLSEITPDPEDIVDGLRHWRGLGPVPSESSRARDAAVGRLAEAARGISDNAFIELTQQMASGRL